MKQEKEQSNLDIHQLSQQDNIKSVDKNLSVSDEEKKIVDEYFYVIETMASIIYSKKKLPPTVDYNDLLSVGFTGLLKAIRGFNDSKNAQFKTYANIRVRGEMLDFIRKEWRTKASHQHKQMVDDIQKRVAQVLDNALDSKSSVTNLMSKMTTSYVISLETVMENYGDNVEDSSSSIDSDLSLSDEYSFLNTQVGQLLKEDQDFIEMFYRRGLSQKEISYKLNISEATVSRKHNKILEELKEKIKQNE
ncbi:MAG: sigma-70 family RNA polymerase sigma factor [Candidatus Margulisiibacteriota bacterium]